MIKANELRIGNWFQKPFNENYFQVEALEKESIVSPFPINFFPNGGAMDTNSYERIKRTSYLDAIPIPLTQEICRQIFGNVNYPSTFYTNDYFDIKGHRFFKAEYPYIHQLQNLYFALMGNELEVVLSKPEMAFYQPPFSLTSYTDHQ